MLLQVFLKAISFKRLFYAIAFSEEIVLKFKENPKIEVQPKSETSTNTKKPETPSHSKNKKNNRDLFIDLKKSLIMEDQEDSESLMGGITPVTKGRQKKKKVKPANKYEQIIFNRGSSAIILPERMVLPNGVEDVMLYPTAIKHTNTKMFFADSPKKVKKENFLSKESEAEVLIGNEFDS